MSIELKPDGPLVDPLDAREPDVDTIVRAVHSPPSHEGTEMDATEAVKLASGGMLTVKDAQRKYRLSKPRHRALMRDGVLPYAILDSARHAIDPDRSLAEYVAGLMRGGREVMTATEPDIWADGALDTAGGRRSELRPEPVPAVAKREGWPRSTTGRKCCTRGPRSPRTCGAAERTARAPGRSRPALGGWRGKHRQRPPS